jgi:hypothetical protein
VLLLHLASPSSLPLGSLCKFLISTEVKKILLLVLFIVWVLPSGSQSLNYREIFGEDWKKAAAFEKENRSWIEVLLLENHISYPVAISVIFPELIRYSALRDKMEITLLKTLYINLGDDYADFSIGVFQMKPSFAELIRENAPRIAGHGKGLLDNRSRYNDIKGFRKSIVSDLEDPKTQIYYLIAFIKICNQRFRTDRKDEVSQVKFLSTVYNYGIDKTASQIDSMSNRKFFNTKLFKTVNYSYSDISVFWYNQHITETED